MRKRPRAQQNGSYRMNANRERGTAARATGVVALLALLPLAGCATYTPVPLPTAPDLRRSVPSVPAGELRSDIPGTADHAFDPADGLDMTEVATLAVMHNPDLVSERLKAQVAGAQVFAAGLLPDPQLALSLEHPTSDVPGLSNAHSVGLSYALQGLVTRGARLDSAVAHASRVDLEILWREWQVVQEARGLFVKLAHARRKLEILQRIRDLFARRYAQSSEALRRGDVTVDVAGADLSAVLDAESRLGALRRRLAEERHELHALLGLAPEVALHLVYPPAPGSLGRETVDRALRTIAGRRPDLLALEAGYRSQEAEVRRAILAQFPSLSIGITHAGDTSAVRTVGLGVMVTLPVFTRNRGQIALQRATRGQLRAEFQSRLDEAAGMADFLWRRQDLIEEQLREIDGQLPALEKLVQDARAAYGRRDVGALTYLNMEKTLLQERLEREDLAQERWMTRIALDSLLGWPGQDPAGAVTEPPR